MAGNKGKHSDDLNDAVNLISLACQAKVDNSVGVPHHHCSISAVDTVVALRIVIIHGGTASAVFLKTGIA
jgi:hypothetical protein